MTSAAPNYPASLPGRTIVRASVLAAFQLVEDARYRTPEWQKRRQHQRNLAERTVAHRRLARDLRAG